MTIDEITTIKQQLEHCNEVRNATMFELEMVEQQNAELQAKIDELMLEYCPNEMTSEQLNTWAKHQVSVSAEDANAIKAAIASAESYGQPEKTAKTEVPAIVFYPAGSLGEEVES